MKILQVISHGYEDGGAETSVLMLRDELRARGHEVKVLSVSDPDHVMFADYQFAPVPPASRLKSAHHLLYLRSYRALRQAIKDFCPDVIHFHTLTSCSPSVLFATRGLPAILTIHGPEEFTL